MAVSEPPKLNVGLLESLVLFNGLSGESLVLLASELPTLAVEAGEVIVTEGDLAEHMYVILAGELEVFKEGRNGDVRVALLGPNDWFGEMALIESQPRSASVRVLAPTMLVQMGVEHVSELLESRSAPDHARLLLNLARELSRRLRVADGILAQLATSVSGAFLHAEYPEGRKGRT